MEDMSQPRIDAIKCWYGSRERDWSRISFLTSITLSIMVFFIFFLVHGSCSDWGLFGLGEGVLLY